MDKLAYAIRVMNLLDTTEESFGDQLIHFHSSEENRDRKSPTVTLQVCGRYIKASSSRCLPTTGWQEHAAAYRRAEEFIRLSGLLDYRPSIELSLTNLVEALGGWDVT